MTSTTQAMVAAIDEAIVASNPAAEPLLHGLREGKLTRDDLRTFATQYFHLVDSLPRFVSTVHSVSMDANIRRTLLNVLVPLESSPPSISDLWLQTCAALGLFSDSVRASEPTASTAACLGDFEYLCHSGSVEGVAALYAWMSRMPHVYRVEQAALAEHYDLASGPGVQFFEAMSFQAHSHSRALRAALTVLLDQHPEAHANAMDAASSAITAVKGLYAGAFAAVR
jgi:pyrroloquinoline-quinone synthase